MESIDVSISTTKSTSTNFRKHPGHTLFNSSQTLFSMLNWRASSRSSLLTLAFITCSPNTDSNEMWIAKDGWNMHKIIWLLQHELNLGFVRAVQFPSTLFISIIRVPVGQHWKIHISFLMFVNSIKDHTASYSMQNAQGIRNDMVHNLLMVNNKLSLCFSKFMPLRFDAILASSSIFWI